MSLWDFLGLVETSQQLINKTTWLKVTFHCKHCQDPSSEKSSGLSHLVCLAAHKGSSEQLCQQAGGLCDPD
jgi:hypothetical protein